MNSSSLFTLPEQGDAINQQEGIGSPEQGTAGNEAQDPGSPEQGTAGNEAQDAGSQEQGDAANEEQGTRAASQVSSAIDTLSRSAEFTNNPEFDGLTRAHQGSIHVRGPPLPPSLVVQTDFYKRVPHPICEELIPNVDYYWQRLAVRNDLWKKELENLKDEDQDPVEKKHDACVPLVCCESSHDHSPTTCHAYELPDVHLPYLHIVHQYREEKGMTHPKIYHEPQTSILPPSPFAFSAKGSKHVKQNKDKVSPIPQIGIDVQIVRFDDLKNTHHPVRIKGDRFAGEVIQLIPPPMVKYSPEKIKYCQDQHEKLHKESRDDKQESILTLLDGLSNSTTDIYSYGSIPREVMMTNTTMINLPNASKR